MLHSVPLSVQEQSDLARAWQLHQSPSALERLLQPLLPRLARQAKRLSSQNAEDLLNEGIIALIEAIGRWRPERHDNLAAFAWPAVRGAMLRVKVSSGASVSVPERRLRDGLAGRLGKDIQEDFRQLMNSETYDESCEMLSSPASEDLALWRERNRLLRRVLARALRPLDRIERRLVIAHLLRENEGIESLSRRLSLSPSRARALEARAVAKMRNVLMIKGFTRSDFV